MTRSSGHLQQLSVKVGPAKHDRLMRQLLHPSPHPAQRRRRDHLRRRGPLVMRRVEHQPRRRVPGVGGDDCAVGQDLYGTSTASHRDRAAEMGERDTLYRRPSKLTRASTPARRCARRRTAPARSPGTASASAAQLASSPTPSPVSGPHRRRAARSARSSLYACSSPKSRKHIVLGSALERCERICRSTLTLACG